MLINQELLDDLLAKTADSPRLRVNLDLRNSSEDTSQRMLNALQSGSLVDIHRHSNTSETVAILRGAVTEIFYDEKGVECGRYEFVACHWEYGSTDSCRAVAYADPSGTFSYLRGKGWGG